MIKFPDYYLFILDATSNGTHVTLRALFLLLQVRLFHNLAPGNLLGKTQLSFLCAYHATELIVPHTVQQYECLEDIMGK